MHACMAIIQHIHNFFYSLLDVKLRSPLQKDFLAWQVCVLGLNVHVWVGVGGGGDRVVPCIVTNFSKCKNV